MAMSLHARSHALTSRKPFGASNCGRTTDGYRVLTTKPPRHSRHVCSSARSAESVRLLQLLDQGGSSPEVDDLVAKLSNSSAEFNEDLIGGGPWAVGYERGIPILWGLGWKLGKVMQGSNQASQDLDPATRTVVSKVQYWGDKLFVTASGVYEPEGSSSALPKKVNVTVNCGCIHAFGVDIPLPIQGKGSFEVLYLDDLMRIFRAPGGLVVVQVKLDRLKTLPAIDSDVAMS